MPLTCYQIEWIMAKMSRNHYNYYPWHIQTLASCIVYQCHYTNMPRATYFAYTHSLAQRTEERKSARERERWRVRERVKANFSNNIANELINDGKLCSTDAFALESWRNRQIGLWLKRMMFRFENLVSECRLATSHAYVLQNSIS